MDINILITFELKPWWQVVKILVAIILYVNEWLTSTFQTFVCW